MFSFLWLNLLFNWRQNAGRGHEVGRGQARTGSCPVSEQRHRLHLYNSPPVVFSRAMLRDQQHPPPTGKVLYKLEAYTLARRREGCSGVKGWWRARCSRCGGGRGVRMYGTLRSDNGSDSYQLYVLGSVTQPLWASASSVITRTKITHLLRLLEERLNGGFPDTPVIDSTLPMQGVRVQSLVGELRSCMSCGLAQPTNQPTSWLPRAATAKEHLAVCWRLGQEFWRGPMPRGHPSFWWGWMRVGKAFPLTPSVALSGHTLAASRIVCDPRRAFLGCLSLWRSLLNSQMSEHPHQDVWGLP